MSGYSVSSKVWPGRPMPRDQRQMLAPTNPLKPLKKADPDRSCNFGALQAQRESLSSHLCQVHYCSRTKPGFVPFQKHPACRHEVKNSKKNSESPHHVPLRLLDTKVGQVAAFFEEFPGVRRDADPPTLSKAEPKPSIYTIKKHEAPQACPGHPLHMLPAKQAQDIRVDIYKESFGRVRQRASVHQLLVEVATGANQHRRGCHAQLPLPYETPSSSFPFKVPTRACPFTVLGMSDGHSAGESPNLKAMTILPGHVDITSPQNGKVGAWLRPVTASCRGVV